MTFKFESAGIESAEALELVLLTGVSGSGKSVALAALEDAGYFCVDNLPPELLLDLVAVEQKHKARKVAVAMDARSATGLPGIPADLKTLQAQGIKLIAIYLETTTDALVRRFSETRRAHPLLTGDAKIQNPTRVLMEAIALERDLLKDLRDKAHVIDTSQTSAAGLRTQIKQLIEADNPESGLQLMFESFAFKQGIPMDADFVFDVRMLPNPHYEPTLRALTGLDQGVIDYLLAQPAVDQMRAQISEFLLQWLPSMARDHRAYVTVAIGCTGGQHRSVYLAQTLCAQFAKDWSTQVRHRELEKKANV
jgi:UPF0042 nucleotide-binding protein